MKIKNLKILKYLYLIIPIICFFVGWLKPIVSIPLSILLLGTIILFFLKNKGTTEIIDETEKDNHCFIDSTSIALIFLTVLLICITAGQGNVFYQSEDWHWRNAIFRDLINIKWPVYYEQLDASLTYYRGHYSKEGHYFNRNIIIKWEALFDDNF